MIADLNRVKYSFHPYNVNRLSITAGAAAVADEAYFAACTAAIRQTRAWTVGELENLGFTVLPSQANFVFVRHSQLPGETLYRKLKENGVLVRWFDADDPGLYPHYHRIHGADGDPGGGADGILEEL